MTPKITPVSRITTTTVAYRNIRVHTHLWCINSPTLTGEGLLLLRVRLHDNAATLHTTSPQLHTTLPEVMFHPSDHRQCWHALMSHLHAVLPEEDQALISIDSDAPVDHRSISLTRKTTIGQTGSNQMTSSILSGAADCAQIATQTRHRRSLPHNAGDGHRKAGAAERVRTRRVSIRSTPTVRHQVRNDDALERA